MGVGVETLDRFRDAGEIQAASAEWLREHGSELTKAGGEVGRALVHALMGIVVGLLAFFRHPSQASRPLAAALAGRVRRFAESFEMVVVAQVEISAINTLLTAVYLLGILPLVAGRLPFAGTLVAVTFLVGLVPVVGNLVSNTVIVVLSFGISPWAALLSLVFLVGIHKLEYFVNAKIIGGRIGASSWEILLSIIAFEVAFGVPGVVMAPIVYAYVKQELSERELV
jgi:predicted PurR-regulated permease PerM